MLKRNKLLILVIMVFAILGNAAYIGYAFVFRRVVDYITDCFALFIPKGNI